MKFSKPFNISLLLFVFLMSARVNAEYGRGNKVPDSMLLKPGQVSAKILQSDAELIGGPKSKGLVGDFILINNRVGFIISGTRPSTGWWTPMGGVVEDAGLIRDQGDGKYWWNIIGEAPIALYRGDDPMFSERLIQPEKAELIKDGSDGEAIVRIHGRDCPFPIRDETLGSTAIAIKVEVMIDYILRPDVNTLEIKITMLNGSEKNKSVGIGQVLVLGDGTDEFIPGRGFQYGKIDGFKTPFFGADSRHVSYGWFPEDGNVTVHTRISKPFITKLDKITIPAKGEASSTMYLAVGDGGMDSIFRQYFKQKKIDAVGTIKGAFRNGKMPAHEETSVSLMDPDGNVLNRTYPGDDGSYSLVAEPGEYQLQAWSFDREIPKPVRVVVKAGETSTVDLDISEPGVLAFDVKDEKGAPIPSVISFKSVTDNGGDDERFFSNRNGGGFFKNHFSIQGTGQVPIRPGKYEVYFSRGLEYEYQKFELEFKAGETKSVSATLTRAVDTSGYLSSDFHIHSAPSFDTSDTISEKVAASYITGIDVPVATDHNMLTDYGPAIRELGLEKQVKSIVGDEITTMRLGHFNAFPLLYKPLSRNKGAVEYSGKTIPEVFHEVRTGTSNPVLVQLNHARTTGGGYLGFVGYDPAAGIFKDKANGTLEFDGLEVLNGNGYGDMEKSMLDWFSFTNHGKKVAGAGNSDSHRIYNIQLGYPINYVRSATDIPGDMVESEFIQSVLGQHMTVSGGPFVVADVNGTARMGDLVTDTDGEIELHVNIQAPTWIEFNTISIIANGEEAANIKVHRPADKTRVTETFKLNPKADTWYVVRVDGEKDMFPVFPGNRAVSFTNPIYVDVDGNGKFDPLYSFNQ